jgi:hypothetical protein
MLPTILAEFVSPWPWDAVVVVEPAIVREA